MQIQCVVAPLGSPWWPKVTLRGSHGPWGPIGAYGGRAKMATDSSPAFFPQIQVVVGARRNTSTMVRDTSEGLWVPTVPYWSYRPSLLPQADLNFSPVYQPRGVSSGSQTAHPGGCRFVRPSASTPGGGLALSDGFSPGGDLLRNLEYPSPCFLFVARFPLPVPMV